MPYLKEMLTAYRDTGIYPFHMPGHKRYAADFPNPYEVDITEIEGFDNLHHAEGILAEAQRRAADLYGSKECFYLINGSTCGLLAAISAAGKRGDRILMARNCHQAVYHGLYLREFSAQYLYPQITSCGIQGAITGEQAEEAFSGEAAIAAVVITSPTYEGIVSDIREIAEIAHRHGAVLIVDEAHGAHFGFGGDFPENAVKQGADAVIMSLHKTLPSFTQTALLHLCSDRIDVKKIKKYLRIYESSSPSYVLMAGMDSCIKNIKSEGQQQFSRFRKKLDAFYQSVADLKKLHVMSRKDLHKGEAFDWDDSKIVIFTGKSGMTGKELSHRLLEEYHLQMEMVSGDYVLAMSSIMDTEEGFARLCTALYAIERSIVSCDGPEHILSESLTAEIYRPNRKKMEIWQAWDLPEKEVSLADAAGEVSADFICPYPPGIPMIVPGEIIGEDFPDRIRECRKQNLLLEGGGNLSSDRINIVYF